MKKKKEASRSPGFWKFNNSLLVDKEYTSLIQEKIPQFAAKYQELEDIGLFWEMIKMEIRATSIIFAKRKARQRQNEEKLLLEKFNYLQQQLYTNFNQNTKSDMERVKDR